MNKNESRATPPSPSTTRDQAAVREGVETAETRMDTGFQPLFEGGPNSPSATPIAEDEQAAFEAWWQEDALKSWRSTLSGSEYSKPMPDGWGDGYKRHALCAWQARAALSSRPAGDVEELNALVEEWLCESCNTVYPGPPKPGLFCVMCPQCGGTTGPRGTVERRALERKIADLRAQLARQSHAMPFDLTKLTRWTFDGGMTAAVAKDGQWVAYKDLAWRFAAPPLSSEQQSSKSREKFSNLDDSVRQPPLSGEQQANAEEIAKARWNAQADQFNQWSELGQDEKDEIIRAAAEQRAEQACPSCNDIGWPDGEGGLMKCPTCDREPQAGQGEPNVG